MYTLLYVVSIFYLITMRNKIPLLLFSYNPERSLNKKKNDLNLFSTIKFPIIAVDL